MTNLEKALLMQRHKSERIGAMKMAVLLVLVGLLGIGTRLFCVYKSAPLGFLLLFSGLCWLTGFAFLRWMGRP